MTPGEFESHFDAIRQLTRQVSVAPDKVLRLFAIACVRSAWHLLRDPRGRIAVEVAERFVNGISSSDDLAAARETLTSYTPLDVPLLPGQHDAMSAARDTCLEDAWWAACNASRHIAEAAGEIAKATAYSIDPTTGLIHWKPTTDLSATHRLGAAKAKAAISVAQAVQLTVLKGLMLQADPS